MRIPLNWLNEFVSLPKDRKLLTDKLTMAGHLLDKTDTVNGNAVIDLELRGNRADCYSIVGIAREVSALFGNQLKYPKITLKLNKASKLKDFKLEVKTPLVKRVMMAEIKNVVIGQSPKWLKDRLIEYGITPINNIVDLTNYVMVETGEPMHAFDSEKIGKNLEIRLAQKGEKMTTFQDKTLTLASEDLVWANDNSVLSVAGAIGGKYHSITDSTKNVLLEAASYDRANIRRSIHRHNLLTDAGIRHEKDLDPNIVEGAMLRFLSIVEKNKWGRVTPQISDYYPNPATPWKIATTYEYIDSLAGFVIAPVKIKQILKGLNFIITKSSPKTLEVQIPTYRTDVRLEEDLIEEILRVHGYEKVPTRILSLEIPDTITPSFITQEEKIKNVLVGIGFDEVISSSFVRESYLKYNQGTYEPVRVSNKPSSDIEELRTTLFPNLLEFTQKILNERGTEAYLFEAGKIYFKEKGNYVEKRKLGIVYCQKKDAEFVYFKGFLEAFFAKLNLPEIAFTQTGTDKYDMSLNKTIVGYGHRLENVFYAEIDLDAILDKETGTKAALWPKYPPQIEDITLAIPPKTKIGEVINTILQAHKLIADVELKDTYKDSYTFRVWYQDKNKTLNNQEVEKIRNKLLNEIKVKFGAILKA